MSRRYPFNFAITKTWGMQSNALDKSMRTATAKTLYLPTLSILQLALKSCDLSYNYLDRQKKNQKVCHWHGLVTYHL